MPLLITLRIKYFSIVMEVRQFIMVDVQFAYSSIMNPTC